jgi:hypothetical protein
LHTVRAFARNACGKVRRRKDEREDERGDSCHRKPQAASKRGDQRIRFAIANKRLLRFRLHDLLRIAEPHDYGIRGGAPQLLVYQVGGKSRSGRLPAWRWVVLGHASDFEVLDETFAGSRNAEARHHVVWDKIFARVE